MDTIFIEEIEFYGYHGSSDEEQAVGHRYSVDVELRCDTSRPGRTDDLGDTVNYVSVAQTIIAVATREKYRLMERLADCLARAVVSEYPVQSVRLRVRKLHPPINAIARTVGVEIERCRDQYA